MQIVMRLMTHKINRRYKFGEQLEMCLNQNRDWDEVTEKGRQLMSNKCENLKIIQRKLKAVSGNKKNLHTVIGNYPRELSNWMKHSFYQKKYHFIQQICLYISDIFLPNIVQCTRSLSTCFSCPRY